MRLLASLFALVLSAVALTVPGLAAPAATGEIRGQVVAPDGPVAGATVQLFGPATKQATTTPGGAFQFAGLPPGRYALSANKAGYVPATLSLALEAGDVKTVQLRLQGGPKRDAPPEKAAEAERKVMADSAPRGRGPATAVGGAVLPSMAAPPSPMAPAAGHAAPAPRPGRVASGVLAAQPNRGPQPNTEEYRDYGVRQWVFAKDDRLSTFAIDVDSAAYTIARRKLREGELPPAAAVRVEEFVNYFRYGYPAPADAPFNVALEAAPSPFEPRLTLLRVGIKGQEPSRQNRKPVHLTFLVDTSGSMNSPDKLGLVKRALRFLVDQLENGDTVALATYAGSVREVLRPTGMVERAKIHTAIEDLSAGGSTAMASGLELAYRLAYDNIKGNAVNRVIVCSDGDANVGRTAHGDMLSSIRKYAEEGVTLSTIGFGMGNYKDERMEQLANKGNGNYYYVDGFSEAKRIFGEKLLGTLQVIAKDVKVQVDFDPAAVNKYRLVGYENRNIADEDFRNDRVDAGELGAGHTVTALYELELTDPNAAFATVRLRWKAPDGDRAAEKAFPVQPGMRRARFEDTSVDTQRAVAVAALAENLRNSPFAESWTLAKALSIAERALRTEDKEELELLELLRTTIRLKGR